MTSDTAPVFPGLEWPGQSWLRSNILLDSSGSARGHDGTSRSLTRGRDRALLREIRADAQAIVTSGSTVRAEGWHLPPHGALVVVSRSELDLAECPDPSRVRVIRFDDDDNSAVATQLRTVLAQLDATRVVCESGPTLLRQLVSASLVDEAFVSVVNTEAPPGKDSDSAAHLQKAVDMARATVGLVDAEYDLDDSVVDDDVTYLRFSRMPSR